MKSFSLVVEVLFFIGVFFVSIFGVLWFFQDNPVLSPITSSTTFQFLTHLSPPATNKKIVYGFLPYWNFGQVTLQPELTNIAYFSLSIDGNGNIVQTQNGGVDEGYHDLQSEDLLNILNTAAQQHTKPEIVLSMMDNDQISHFLLSSDAQSKVIKSLDAVLLGYPFQGVNIDIEYTGPVTQNLQDDYTNFIQLLRNHLQQHYKNIDLSVDILASASGNRGIWDLQNVAKQVDYIVVMAYDFHRTTSIMAGPVAPLFGGQKLWDSDVTQHLRNLLLLVPKQKLLLGIPFYGYEWQTTSRNPQAQTFPNTGEMASEESIQQILNQKKELGVQEGWSDDALSPYLSYLKDGQIHMIYYENSRSLSYKLDLVNQLDLGGIAIWALGYEKNSRELWDVVQHKL